MWKGVSDLIAEIKRCEEAGATTAALAMAYICIDTMTILALPVGCEKHVRSDFIAWTNKYLRGHEDQLYQYRGIDVYGARCALLHTFGSEVNYHQQNPDAKKFAYHDSTKHIYDPTQNQNLVIIGITSFINDVLRAVNKFIHDCKIDNDLRTRVETRFPAVLNIFPLNI